MEVKSHEGVEKTSAKMKHSQKISVMAAFSSTGVSHKADQYMTKLNSQLIM